MACMQVGTYVGTSYSINKLKLLIIQNMGRQQLGAARLLVDTQSSSHQICSLVDIPIYRRT